MNQPTTRTAHITFLEMASRPSLHVPRPSRPALALMRAKHMPVAFYRYLYDQVGGPHHWYLRKEMDDAALAEVIHAQTTHIDVVYADGCPAGFFELDTKNLPDKVELAYFGLCRDYVGMGLGKWFLATAIDAAWEHEPERLAVNTNSLDHPTALPLYQRLGFVAVGQKTEEIPVID